MLAFHGTLQLIFVINLLSTFDSNFVIRYITNVCVINKVARFESSTSILRNVLQIITEIAVTLAITGQLHLVYEELQKIECSKKEVFNSELRKLLRDDIFYLMLAFLTGLCHRLKVLQSDEHYYEYSLLLYSIPNKTLSSILCIFYISTTPFLSYCAIVLILIYAHLLKFTEIHFTSIASNLKDLSSKTDHLNENYLIENSNYQKEVFTSLKSYITHHSSLKA